MCSPPAQEQAAAKRARDPVRTQQGPKLSRYSKGSDSGRPSTTSQDGDSDAEVRNVDDEDSEAAVAERVPTVYGVFHPDRYLEGQDCIHYEGHFVTRSKFERLGGSLMAKWYRSIRVVSSDEPLGAWLARRGLPVLKGNPRTRRQLWKDDVDQSTRLMSKRPRKGAGVEGEGAKGGNGAPGGEAARCARPGAPHSTTDSVATAAAGLPHAMYGGSGRVAAARPQPATPRSCEGATASGATCEWRDATHPATAGGSALLLAPPGVTSAGSGSPCGPQPPAPPNGDGAWATGAAHGVGNTLAAGAAATYPSHDERSGSIAASCSASARTGWLPGLDEAPGFLRTVMQWTPGGTSPGSPQASSVTPLHLGGTLGPHTPANGSVFDAPWPGGARLNHRSGSAPSAAGGAAAGFARAFEGLGAGGVVCAGPSQSDALQGAAAVHKQRQQSDLSSPDWLSCAWAQYSGGEEGALVAAAAGGRPSPAAECWPPQRHLQHRVTTADTDRFRHDEGVAEGRAAGCDTVYRSANPGLLTPRSEPGQQLPFVDFQRGRPNAVSQLTVNDEPQQRLALDAQRGARGGAPAASAAGWGTLSYDSGTLSAQPSFGAAPAHQHHQLRAMPDALLQSSSSSMVHHHLLASHGSSSPGTTATSVSGSAPLLMRQSAAEAAFHSRQLLGGGSLAARRGHLNRIEAVKQELLRAGQGAADGAAWASSALQPSQLQRAKVAANFDTRVQQLMMSGSGGHGGHDTRGAWGLGAASHHGPASSGGGAIAGANSSSLANAGSGARLQGMRVPQDANQPPPAWPAAPQPLPQQAMQGCGNVGVPPAWYGVQGQCALSGWGSPQGWNL